jgi:hypothetical protein
MEHHLYTCPSDQKDDDSSYPALRFERLFELENIGRGWTMPDGISMKEMEDRMWQDVLISAWDHACFQEESSKLMKVFNQLNPELTSIDVNMNDHMSIRGFLHGIVSGFNAKDIDAFINNKRASGAEKDLEERILKEYQKPPHKSWYPHELREEFAELTRRGVRYPPQMLARVSWVPAADTIKNIQAQLDLKESSLCPYNVIKG